MSLQIVQLQGAGQSEIEPVCAIRNGDGFFITGRAPEGMEIGQILRELARMLPQDVSQSSSGRVTEIPNRR
jgi:hypothetical protein